MQENGTNFLRSFRLLHKQTYHKQVDLKQQIFQGCQLTSKQILNNIFNTLNCSDNYRDDRKHKFSLCSDETGSQTHTKCNCKKSKCLKLYCQCFAQGSFCNNCNCDCCQNTQEYSQIRAKAIDQMIMRTSVSYGQKGSTFKGCNCKKTGCLKKYCQCFNTGDKCGEYCKCNNCQNCQ